MIVDVTLLECGLVLSEVGRFVQELVRNLVSLAPTGQDIGDRPVQQTNRDAALLVASQHCKARCICKYLPAHGQQLERRREAVGCAGACPGYGRP